MIYLSAHPFSHLTSFSHLMGASRLEILVLLLETSTNTSKSSLLFHRVVSLCESAYLCTCSLLDLHVCDCACTCVHIYIHMCMCVRMCTYVYTVCVCLCMYVCIRTYIYTYIHMYVYIRILVCMCMHARSHIDLHTVEPR